MNGKAYLPKTLLSPFIRTYLVIESEEELVNRILPATSLVMTFRYKGQVNQLTDNTKNKLPSFAVSGLRKSSRLINYTKYTGNILVVFKEAGASAFFKEPLHELFEESASLDNFISRQNLAELEEQLSGASNITQRIELVEQFLLSRLFNPKPDRLVLSAMEKIHAAKGMIRIKELADSLYISQDAFEKRFRKIAGASPKQFSYIIRMKSIISSGLKKQTLTELAFDAGYFDQPHFNKDFKLFTGQTPTDFFKSPVFW